MGWRRRATAAIAGTAVLVGVGLAVTNAAVGATTAQHAAGVGTPPAVASSAASGLEQAVADLMDHVSALERAAADAVALRSKPAPAGPEPTAATAGDGSASVVATTDDDGDDRLDDHGGSRSDDEREADDD